MKSREQSLHRNKKKNNKKKQCDINMIYCISICGIHGASVPFSGNKCHFQKTITFQRSSAFDICMVSFM